MSELTDLRPPEPLGADRADLRPVLEAMRKEATDEIARLKRKLAEREYAAMRSIESATERIALQQELATLQHTLGQKETTLDKITEECRRLEDQLEDQNVAFDGLKQEVQRKEMSLKAARDEVLRLQQELVSIREQSVDLSQSLAFTGLPLPPVEPDPPRASLRRVVTFAAGLASGLLAIGVVVLVLWPKLEMGWPRWSTPEDAAPLPSVQSSAASNGAAAVSPPPASADAEPVPPVSLAAPVEPAPTERDRLRDGSSGPQLARLAGGLYRMGHNTLSGGDSGPEHDVAIAPFLIGAYEVTYQEYDRFARATGRRLPDDFGWGRGTRPVVGVSWSDAEAYADWLSRQTGRRYRLPSESEWELAARAGSRSSFWWGTRLEPARALCFDCGTPWDNRSTAPVGSFPPNAYGLFDTSGNALEWVADCYAPGYEGAPADGRPRLDRDCAARVARGGAFNKPSASMRVWARAKQAPETRLNSLGFRVARDP